jgi:ribosomal protein S10
MADTTKIRIRLKAFDHQLLDKSTSDIAARLLCMLIDRSPRFFWREESG